MSELENLTQEETNKALFSHLIMSLASSAMQHMGKLVNPMTNKTEINRDAAQTTIDMLEMIQAKTKGNLDSDESRFLDQTLTGLRLNFVDLPAEAPAMPPPAKEAKPAEEPPKADEAPGENKKRFSKKYD